MGESEIKDGKRILVVPVDRLFGKYGGRYFQGFTPLRERDFMRIILENYRWARRGKAENDFTQKQAVPYAIIFNPDTGRIFTDRRANSGGEGRLNGIWPTNTSIATTGIVAPS